LRFIALLPLAALGGCAGYAADYLKDKETLVAPGFARYGMTSEQNACVTGRLKTALSVWQMRQLGDLAGRAVPGGQNARTFTPHDLRSVAGLVKDQKVGIETGRALDACGISTTVAAIEPAPEAPAADPATPETAPTASAPAAATAPPVSPPLWVNLGTAASGQAISVDAASLENQPGWRQGWFRLANPGEAGPGALSYRLRVDCVAGSIFASGGRKYGTNGAITEQKDYPAPEGPLAIESGTVMEIAYRALCS
jgi:hypothetical protein